MLFDLGKLRIRRASGQTASAYSNWLGRTYTGTSWVGGVVAYLYSVARQFAIIFPTTTTHISRKPEESTVTKRV